MLLQKVRRFGGIGFVSFSSGLLLIACGGGGDSKPPPTGPVLLTDGIVTGIDYKSTSPDGKTTTSGQSDASGVSQSVLTYQYIQQNTIQIQAQAPIIYSIGGGFTFTLPNLLPFQTASVLQADGKTSKTVNVPQFYTLLDVTTDQNQLINLDTVLETVSSTPASAGITITANMRKAQLPTFNNNTTTLANDILAIKTAADTADPSVTHTVPTPEQALAHVKASWQCSMVGFYTGSGYGKSNPSGYYAPAPYSYLALLPNGTMAGVAIVNQNSATLSGTLQFPSQTVNTTAMLDIGKGAAELITFNYVWDGPRQLATSSGYTDASGNQGNLVATRQMTPTTPVVRYAAAPVTWTSNGYIQNSALFFDIDANNNVTGSMIADVVYNNGPSPWYGTVSGDTLTATVPTGDTTGPGYAFKFTGTIDPTSGDITTGTLLDYHGNAVAYITPNAPMTHCHM